MGATQIDQYGNQNIAAIGDYKKPKAQLLGLRGSPGNLINHRTSYWVPNHSQRSFVSKVDIVSGPGYDRMRTLRQPDNRFHDVHRVVSNLGVFDFETPENRMRIRSIHPGVEMNEVIENTSFELIIPVDVDMTRVPDEEELRIIDIIDPTGMRYQEVSGA